MRLKTFAAPDTRQAMALLRRELGADAIIVATQELPDGGVRITGAVENQDLDLAELLAPPPPAPDDRQLLAAADPPPAARAAARAPARGGAPRRRRAAAALGQALHETFGFAPLAGTRRRAAAVRPAGRRQDRLARQARRRRGAGRPAGDRADRRYRARRRPRAARRRCSPRSTSSRSRRPTRATLRRLVGSAAPGQLLIDSPGCNAFRPADLGLLSQPARGQPGGAGPGAAGRARRRRQRRDRPHLRGAGRAPPARHQARRRAPPRRPARRGRRRPRVCRGRHRPDHRPGPRAAQRAAASRVSCLRHQELAAGTAASGLIGTRRVSRNHRHRLRQGRGRQDLARDQPRPCARPRAAAACCCSTAISASPTSTSSSASARVPTSPPCSAAAARSPRRCAASSPAASTSCPDAPAAGELGAIAPALLERLLGELAALAQRYEFTLLDLPAGIDRAVRRLLRAAALRLVVTTDEPTALTDAYALIKVSRNDGTARRAAARDQPRRRPRGRAPHL